MKPCWPIMMACVFGRRLVALVGAGGVERLEVEQLQLVERREVLARAGVQVAAGALDPEDLGREAVERILLGDLRRRVAAAGVGDALVAAEQVRAVNKAANRIERGGAGVIPVEVDELV